MLATGGGRFRYEIFQWERSIPDLVTVKETIESRQPGATIIPVIISTDKPLTLFQNEHAYPIYMTIGNIPKNIRREPSRMAHVLIGFIPTSKPYGLTKAARQRAFANIFHMCMRDVLQPIIEPGITGVAMMSGDGVWRRCHPVFANFVGDYPEQALVTCTYDGRCPKCLVTPDELGEYRSFPPHLQSSAMDTYILADEKVDVFHAACRKAGLKPVNRPFWESFPFTDIFVSISPVVLRELLQGMIKNLIGWVVDIFGATQIDARCRTTPPNHKVMLFPEGITTWSPAFGHEHKKICRILLGFIIDLRIPNGFDSTRLVRAVRALLDFLYLAQYQCHTSETLDRLEDALSEFHDNKAIFTDLRVREHFNIPKLHGLTHYVSSIRLFGTTDNFNSEHSERLYIDFAKEADDLYVTNTNREDIYDSDDSDDSYATYPEHVYSQMAAWLERHEKILLHTTFINQRHRERPGQPQTRRIPEPPSIPTQTIKMATDPTKSATFDDLARYYGALDFQDALTDFLAGLETLSNPGPSASTARRRAAVTPIPFRRVPVFHSVRFTKCGHSGEPEISDSVYARPQAVDSRRRIIPARFDTVIVRQDGDPQDQGNKGESHSYQN